MDDQRDDRASSEGLAPRFRLSTVLISVTVIAIWLSTFNGYAGSEPVRKTIMLAILLVGLFSAIYCRDRQKAFWIGFLSVMLLAFMRRQVRAYLIYSSAFEVPDEIYRAWYGLRNSVPVTTASPAVYDTIHLAYYLALGTLAGLLAIYIRSLNQQRK